MAGGGQRASMSHMLDWPLQRITSPYTTLRIVITFVLTEPVTVTLNTAGPWYGSSCSRKAPLASAVVG